MAALFSAWTNAILSSSFARWAVLTSPSACMHSRFTSTDSAISTSYRSSHLAASSLVFSRLSRMASCSLIRLSMASVFRRSCARADSSVSPKTPHSSACASSLRDTAECSFLSARIESSSRSATAKYGTQHDTSGACAVGACVAAPESCGGPGGAVRAAWLPASPPVASPSCSFEKRQRHRARLRRLTSGVAAGGTMRTSSPRS
mmetsp:Transcript_1695/g.5541  ORF Transcript_1695/g.5541 Transcript_1695/m.5541 type:complete len:204 (-) Transcript_1695:356-967(-)